MRRGSIAILLVVLMLVVAGLLWLRARGRSADAPGVPGDGAEAAIEHVDAGSSSTSRPRTGGARRASRGAAAGDQGDGAAARERAGVTVDVVDGERGGDEGGGEFGDPDEDIVDLEAELPMAHLGASLGIDTSMDDDWTVEDEAAQWFDPLESDFQASRPLNPDGYRTVLRDHHETATNVFKRSAEIGDELGPDAGIEFLEAYNELVEDYRREAYGTP
jgi:hypothetical protein